MWEERSWFQCIGYDYMACTGCMDRDVHCPQKAIELYHSLTLNKNTHAAICITLAILGPILLTIFPSQFKGDGNNILALIIYTGHGICTVMVCAKIGNDIIITSNIIAVRQIFHQIWIVMEKVLGPCFCQCCRQAHNCLYLTLFNLNQLGPVSTSD